MDKNGLPWEENDYVKLNICVQNNGLKMHMYVNACLPLAGGLIKQTTVAADWSLLY